MTVLLLLSMTSCERREDLPDGVMRVFGRMGVGPGEFAYPRAIAVDASGSIFVVDKAGRVQRFAPDGTLEAAWRMPDVQSGLPVGLSVHPDGRLFIPDTHYHRVLVTDRDGKVLDSFGREGTGDGEFQLPTDVVFDATGNIYVGEYFDNDRITKWSPDLKYIKAFGDEPIEGRRLSRPAALAIDEEQTLWVADACNHRLVRFSLNGEVLAVVGRMGDQPGAMRYPYDLSIAPDGSLLVCEYGGNRLQWFSPDGRSLRTWGEAGRAPGKLFAPWGATYGPDGNVYVCDSLNYRIQVLRP